MELRLEGWLNWMWKKWQVCMCMYTSKAREHVASNGLNTLLDEELAQVFEIVAWILTLVPQVKTQVRVTPCFSYSPRIFFLESQILLVEKWKCCHLYFPVSSVTKHLPVSVSSSGEHTQQQRQKSNRSRDTNPFELRRITEWKWKRGEWAQSFGLLRKKQL